MKINYEVRRGQRLSSLIVVILAAIWIYVLSANNFFIYASCHLVVYPLAEAFDVTLHAESAQVMAHGTDYS